MNDFDWSLPYPSQREGVFARNVVATSQPLAAQAGLRVLGQGGNAIDAAIATAIALTVVEPTSNGIGSDAFALIWAGGGLHGLNACGRSPAAMTSDRYAGLTAIPTQGWGGVTVPGAVSAWVEMSERFGRLPFEQLFEPAIEYARHGFHVSRQTAYYWDRGFRANRNMGPWMATFCPAGRPLHTGEMFVSEAHARTLEQIALSKGESFYHGELAVAIARHARETGGLITADDLASHKADWVRPISLDWHGFRIHQIPPNGQGIIGLMALGLLARHRLDEVEVDSADSLHMQIEAMKLAFVDGRRFVADPDAMDVEPAALLDPEYLDARARLIDRDRAADPGHGEPKRGGTVYLCAADSDGNMVSYIQSNYTGFGSGIVIPDTGIAMQNRGCCFTLETGHPNQVGPGKRPYHTIIPGFVTQVDGGGTSVSLGGRAGAAGATPAPLNNTVTERPILAFGVMGGYMQPQGHAQVLLRMLLHRQNPQAALDAPRWRIEQGLQVVIEPGFAHPTYEALLQRGHQLTVAPARTVEHGGGQAIWRMTDGAYFAASDQRRDGQAVGW